MVSRFASAASELACRRLRSRCLSACPSRWSSARWATSKADPRLFGFNREHPAEEVFVTGTFDDWKKSTKLDKLGSAHEKTVELPKSKSDDKILYKVSIL